MFERSSGLLEHLESEATDMESCVASCQHPKRKGNLKKAFERHLEEYRNQNNDTISQGKINSTDEETASTSQGQEKSCSESSFNKSPEKKSMQEKEDKETLCDLNQLVKNISIDEKNEDITSIFEISEDDKKSCDFDSDNDNSFDTHCYIDDDVIQQIANYETTREEWLKTTKNVLDNVLVLCYKRKATFRHPK
ncbi:uncharacterized protein LOC105830290 isoform X2 [Monomorium pharaonis]|uniref:uncharacterized protein LOC105830290 isoform X2 n=1 Tax=Monomorium pharaonis TaxID=307658 RepID=UPI00063F40B5|nr:uncharacterized protein LOC105830290 isoform X2 [Monomorium pharaonis]XP_028049454.1 uncharacterized protein LOC105830290 isoform X2 [Monomorium pharaonis]XP_036151201.1 uncharacterized protein LOC105830290 isoform X2 [Monomorium pharaonis]XP_036151202.1 uncharacterized protein LOC105830290 isoform X2 [Monomorium pharaonis]